MKKLQLSHDVIDEINNIINGINQKELWNFLNSNRGMPKDFIAFTIRPTNKLKNIKKIEIQNESGAQHDPYHFHVTFDDNSEFCFHVETLKQVRPKKPILSKTELKGLRRWYDLGGQEIIKNAWKKQNPNTHRHSRKTD